MPFGLTNRFSAPGTCCTSGYGEYLQYSIYTVCLFTLIYSRNMNEHTQQHVCSVLLRLLDNPLVSIPGFYPGAR